MSTLLEAKNTPHYEARTRSGLWISLACIALFSISFLAASIRLASAKPLWMDEILAVWTARFHPISRIWFATYHGSDFAPPTYHLFLHFLMATAGSSYLLLRLPSILAIFISGLCVFALLRRYFSTAPASFGMAFALLSILSNYGLQVRPYALVTACFAIAVLLWDDLDQTQGRFWRICLISVLLALATSLHFYGVLLVPCMAMMELLWSVLSRKLRISVWIGLFLAGAVSFVWLPLIKTVSQYNVGDIFNLDYYARPTLGRLTLTYFELFTLGKKDGLFLLVALCLVAGAYAFKTLQPPGAQAETAELQERPGAIAKIYIIGFCTTAFPLAAYIFALFVTKAFNTRYTLIACIGISVLAGCVAGHVSELKIVIGPILLAGCALMFIGSSGDQFQPGPGAQELSAYYDGLAILRYATKPYPIVVGEGLQYLQLAEGAPDQMKARLVYVTAPIGSSSPDPTNEHQVERWHPLRPELRIVAAKTFFAQNRQFYLLHTDSSTDVLTNWLLERNLIIKPWAHIGRAWLFEAEAPE